MRGDVEIHRRQRDWDAHGHGDDPNYNGVALHAALEADSPETALHSGNAAPVVSLSGLLDEAEDTEPADLDEIQVASDLWELLAPRGYSRPSNAAEAGELLDRAGDDRFCRKAALLGRFAAEQGPEQTLYEALLEGMGYRHNQQPFVKLAQAAPIAALRRAALPVLAEQRPMVLRHWLLAVSGLDRRRFRRPAATAARTRPCHGAEGVAPVPGSSGQSSGNANRGRCGVGGAIRGARADSWIGGRMQVSVEIDRRPDRGRTR